ncbi:MAG: hypothetical protein KF865_06330 [Bdellovibrionaceae bacterium]|nr:hypothetical protein [Pseudobdellovibrionaceae bacterium]
MQYLKSFVRKETLQNFNTADLIREILRRMKLNHHEQLQTVRFIQSLVNKRR